MEKVSKIQIGCSKYDIQDNEARQLIEELKNSGILNDIDIDATVDSNTGTPNVYVVKGDNSFTLNFTGLKGETGPKGDKGDRGDRGEQGPAGNDGRDGRDGTIGHDGAPGITPSLQATARIGNTVGTPNVEVRRGGTDTNPVFEFIFNGLRGKDGVDGKDGRDGRDGHDGVDGHDGQDGTGSSYDDTALTNRIRAIEQDIIDKWNSINNNMEGEVNRIILDSEWLDTLISGILSQSNFGDDDVDSYLQRIGLYTKNGDTRTWAWSTIQLDVNALLLAVNALNAGVSTSDLTALESRLRIYIDEETGSAINNLSARYARKDAEKILEWMYSELDQGANSELTWNDLVSAAGGNANGALSKVSTNIKKLGNDEYLAKANLVSAITEKKGEVATTLVSAGVMTEAALDHAVADLFAENGETKAAVSAMVGSNGSQIDLTADKINAVTKNATVQTQGLQIKAGNQSYDSSRTININGSDDGTLNINARKLVVDSNSDEGWAYINSEHIHIGDNASNSDITIGSTSSSDGDVSIGTNQGTVAILSTNNNVNIASGTGVNVVNSNLNISRNANLADPNAGNLTIAGDITFNTYVDHAIKVGGGNNKLTLLASSIELNTNAGVISNSAISAPAYNNSSDERYKNIISDVNLSVEQIAGTRTVDYELKNNTGTIYSGAIAQDWQFILPNVVKTIDSEGLLGLNYSSAALVSAVVDAREIVKLKQENEELKQRLAAIEARLANI